MSRIDTLSEYVLGSSHLFRYCDGITALIHWPGQPLVRESREDFKWTVESCLDNEDPYADDNRCADIPAILRDYNEGDSFDEVFAEYLDQFPLIDGLRADAIFRSSGDDYPVVLRAGNLAQVYKETSDGFVLVAELAKPEGESWEDFCERAEDIVTADD